MGHWQLEEPIAPADVSGLRGYDWNNTIKRIVPASVTQGVPVQIFPLPFVVLGTMHVL